MAQDLIYYSELHEYTLNGVNYKEHYINELGEVQQGFNMSLTLDGTKDSVHFQVVSYSKNILKPYTILWHESTNTWWVVSHDKVMRYANESGFMYVHEIDCLGAIELLNARDLTDCGFRSNYYTIAQFVTRLFSLSNFEYSVTYDIRDLDTTKKVDYIKTFENYTLLSALREFFNGYNCGIKLSFRVSSNQIIGATLKVISKTGDTNLETLDIDDFHDIRETRTLDKNSYGTSVITNAQNVISTKSVVFPSVGTARLSSSSRLSVDSKGNISDDAFIRLPSPAYKVNKLTFVAKNFWFGVARGSIVGNDFVEVNLLTTAYDTYDMGKCYDTLLRLINNRYGDDVYNHFLENKDIVCEKIRDISSFDLYDGFLYDAMHDQNSPNVGGYNPFKLPPNAPSGMKAIKFWNAGDTIISGGTNRYIVLTDKATRDSFNLPYMGIYWERGSNLIKGFSYFGLDGTGDRISKKVHLEYSRLGDIYFYHSAYEITINGEIYRVMVSYQSDINDTTEDYLEFNPYNLSFIVDYVPMTDLKIITDNDNKENDIQLYNQSGKLNDSVALSKLTNSYSKEITQENITRYSDYYSFSDLPSLGQLVDDNGTKYVINNLSLDFYQNDQDNNIEYKIECEISMSKQVAVKSLMVNANSNIRDYGIPQQNNVARKQVYRDLFYLGHENKYAGQYNYSPLSNLLEFGFIPSNQNRNLMAFIRCQDIYPIYSTSSDQVQSTTDYTYYQLPTTRFVLSKQLLYKLDFIDNNIIGYDSQNIASGFNVTNINMYMTQSLNTPIGYVDEVGQVIGINIQFDTIDNTSKVYTEYVENNNISGVTYVSQRVYIDDGIYQLAQNYASFEILENSYNKDALEIPVFEIGFQIIDCDDTIIGTNIFDTFEDNYENYRIFYGFTYSNVYVTENNALSLIDNEHTYTANDIVNLQNSCEISATQSKIKIRLHSNTLFIESNNTLTYGSQVTPTKGKDIIISRWVWDINTHTIVKKDLLFVIKNTNNMTINSDNDIELYINHKE